MSTKSSLYYWRPDGEDWGSDVHIYTDFSDEGIFLEICDGIKIRLSAQEYETLRQCLKPGWEGREAKECRDP